MWSGYLRPMRRFLLLLLIAAASFAHGQDKRIADREAKVVSLLQRGKVYKAKAQCDAMLNGTPVPVFYLYRADASNRIGAHADAERDARVALKAGVKPDASLLQLAIAQQGLGQADSALANYTTLLAQGATPELRYRIGLAHQTGRRCAEALVRFREAEAGAEKPLLARILRAQGECLAITGDTTSARAAFDRSIMLDDRDPVTYNSRGWYLHAAQGAHQRAIADYDRALKLNPNYSFAFNNRGWSRFKLGDRDKALADIERARKRRPDNAYVYRNLGLITLAGGDAGKACMHFQAALANHFTALYGDEVELLVQQHCASVPQAPKPPLPPADKQNAPGLPPPRTNAP